MITLTAPTFLYPTSRQFPFDEVCEQIVRALEERNWDVPGIEVEFDIYGSGAEQFRLVRNLRGDDFKLWFCRPQQRLGSWNDTAAVSKINIPKMEISVYEDESGPTFYNYVGNDWEQDKDRFMHSSKLHSKLHGEQRWYLAYKGGWTNEYLYRGRPPLLKANSDLDRQYLPESDEPTSFVTKEVFAVFTQWLETNVLARILDQPAAATKLDVFAEEAIPFPKNIGPIFCFGKPDDAYRTYQGRVDPLELDPSKRYALGPNFRLMSWSVAKDDSVSDLVYDGFIWCGLADVQPTTAKDSLTVPGGYWEMDLEYVFKITPNRANGVYIADHAALEQRRKELDDAIVKLPPGSTQRDFTREEVADFHNARGRTLIPITEYDGSYQQPIVLINRELGFDEVELISGPWPACHYVQLVTNHSQKARELLGKAVSAQQHSFKNWGDAEAEQAFELACAKLHRFVRADANLREAFNEAPKVLRFRRELRNQPQVTKYLVEIARTMNKLGLF